MNRIKSIIISCILLFTAVSCHTDNSKSNNGNTETVTGFGSTEEQIKEVYYRFPAPNEMFSYIRNRDLVFDQSILVPTYLSESIVNTRQQKVFLGIYFADLAYVTLFEQFRTSTEYLKTIHRLSEDLRIDSAFDKFFINRIENNLKNVDSLNVISDEALDKIIHYLTVNEMETTFAVISIGAFVETLHLTTLLTESYNPDDIAIRRLAEQKHVVKNLLAYVNNYRSNPDVAETLKTAMPVFDLLNGLPEERKESNVDKSSGKLKLSGGKKVILTEEKFTELKKITESIREKLLGK